MSLAMLALLSVFAVTLARITSLERQASSNYVSGVDARLLAEAGASCAVAQVRQAIQRRHYATPNDWWMYGRTFPPAADTATENVLKSTDNLDFRWEVQCFDLGGRISVNTRSPGIQAALERVGLTAAQASTLITARDDRGGLRSHKELEELLTPAVYETVRDFITVHDAPVAVPQLDGIVPGDRFQAPPSDYRARGFARPLLNVNTAPEEVLSAVFQGISGYPLVLDGGGTGSEWLNKNSFNGDRGRLAWSDALVEIDGPAAAYIAGEIISNRGTGGTVTGSETFRSWAEFDAFLASKVNGTFTEDHRSLIMATCGTDIRPMSYNPDATRRGADPLRLWDKNSLDSWSMELCLGGSGLFEIRSRGWVTKDAGDAALEKTLAEDRITRVVRIFSSMRFESQQALDAIWSSKATHDNDVYQQMPEPSHRDDPDPFAGHIRLSTETVDGTLGMSQSTSFRGSGGGAQYHYGPGAVDRPMRERGALGPEGAVVWREGFSLSNTFVRSPAAPPTLGTTSIVGDELARSGSIEFWFKLANDANGTDEVLLSFTVDENAVMGTLEGTIEAAINSYEVPGDCGVTVKVERFNDEIRATWFYWGTGAGAVSRFVPVLMEHRSKLQDSGGASWAAGEWHHVVVRWHTTDQNWELVAAGTPITADSSGITDEISIDLDGNAASPVPGGKFSHSALLEGDTWFTIGDDAEGATGESGDGIYDEMDGGTKKNVIYNLGKIGSLPKHKNVYVGGFTNNGSADVWDTGSISGTVRRYANGTFDDVFIYNEATDAPGRTPALRYHPGGTATNFAIPVPQGLSLASLSVDGRVPDVAECGISVACGVTRVLGTDPPSFPASGFPVAARSGLADTTVTVSVTMDGPGDASPVLEGFVAYYLHPTELVEEDERPPLD